MVSPSTDMLSVFITPCTKPTRIHSTIIVAVRSQTSPNQATYRSAAVAAAGRSGKSL
jgi:hypothetical protein